MSPMLMAPARDWPLMKRAAVGVGHRRRRREREADRVVAGLELPSPAEKFRESLTTAIYVPVTVSGKSPSMKFPGSIGVRDQLRPDRRPHVGVGARADDAVNVDQQCAPALPGRSRRRNRRDRACRAPLAGGDRSAVGIVIGGRRGGLDHPQRVFACRHRVIAGVVVHRVGDHDVIRSARGRGKAVLLPSDEELSNSLVPVGPKIRRRGSNGWFPRRSTAEVRIVSPAASPTCQTSMSPSAMVPSLRCPDVMPPPSLSS